MVVLPVMADINFNQNTFKRKTGKKGGGKIQIFKSLYLHHFMNYRAILFCQGVYQFEQNQMAGLWALALGSKVGQGL